MSSRKFNMKSSSEYLKNEFADRRLALDLAELEKKRKTALKNISHEIYSCQEDFNRMKREARLLSTYGATPKPTNSMSYSSKEQPKRHSNIHSCAKHKCNSITKCNDFTQDSISQISKKIKQMEKLLEVASHSMDPDEIKSKIEKARKIVLNLKSSRQKRLGDSPSQDNYRIRQTNDLVWTIKHSKSGAQVKSNCIACKDAMSAAKSKPRRRAKSSLGNVNIGRTSKEVEESKQRPKTAGAAEQVWSDTTRNIQCKPSFPGEHIKRKPKRHQSEPVLNNPPLLAPEATAITLLERKTPSPAPTAPGKSNFNPLDFDRLDNYLIFGIDGLALSEKEKPDDPDYLVQKISKENYIKKNKKSAKDAKRKQGATKSKAGASPKVAQFPNGAFMSKTLRCKPVKSASRQRKTTSTVSEKESCGCSSDMKVLKDLLDMEEKLPKNEYKGTEKSSRMKRAPSVQRQ